MDQALFKGPMFYSVDIYELKCVDVTIAWLSGSWESFLIFSAVFFHCCFLSSPSSESPSPSCLSSSMMCLLVSSTKRSNCRVPILFHIFSFRALGDFLRHITHRSHQHLRTAVKELLFTIPLSTDVNIHISVHESMFQPTFHIADNTCTNLVYLATMMNTAHNSQQTKNKSPTT